MTELRPRSEVLRRAMERPVKSEASAMLTVNEACTHLRISKWSLYRLIQKKELKTIKIGSRRLIPMDAITQLITQLEAAAEE